MYEFVTCYGFISQVHIFAIFSINISYHLSHETASFLDMNQQIYLFILRNETPRLTVNNYSKFTILKKKVYWFCNHNQFFFLPNCERKYSSRKLTKILKNQCFKYLY